MAEKFQRFIDMCDTFHLPIVNLPDQPGFTVGKRSEQQGTIRKGVRASFAMIQGHRPDGRGLYPQVFRRGRGGAKERHPPELALCLAVRRVGKHPVEGGVYAAHRREIESSDDPDACLEKLQETYRAISSPFRTAEAFGIEDIIDPRDTRSLLCEWVEMAYDVEQTRLGPKKRGMRC